MTKKPREMRLTPELVARVPLHSGELPPVAPGRSLATDADHEAARAALLVDAPPGGVWVFAYGSLIWKPGFDSVEERVARARGWRREFCLGWDRRFRGSPERPGLMMALDRGGECKGIAYRLPPDAVEANLERLLRREILIMPPAQIPRWIRLQTEAGPMTAIAFVVDRKGPAYVSGRSPADIADMLARAAGPHGTMAEYLYSTVRHLEDRGLHDRHLWRLQEMVAERIEAADRTAGT